MSDTINKLAGLLGMMGSTYDGEVLNAARLAERMRLKLNKSWSQILSGSQSQSQDTGMLLRALRAEQELMSARNKLSSMAREIASLERELASVRATRAQASSTGSRRRADTKHDVPEGFDDWIIARAKMHYGISRAEIVSHTGIKRKWRPYLEQLAQRSHLTLVMWRMGKRIRFRME